MMQVHIRLIILGKVGVGKGSYCWLFCIITSFFSYRCERSETGGGCWLSLLCLRDRCLVGVVL